MVSYFILLLVVLVLGLIAREAAFAGKDLSRYVTGLGCAVIAFMAAMRAPTVGADTSNYQNFFVWISGIPFGDVAAADTIFWNSQGTEVTYKYFNKIVSIFSNDPQTITIACAVVLGVGLYFLCRQSKDPWLSLLLFVCFGLFQTAMNIAPSCLASILATIGMRYIPQRNVKMFLLCIALGCVFHYSALMFVPLYFLGRIRYRLRVVVGLLVVFFIAVPILYSSIAPLLASVVPYRWAQYLHVERVSLSQLAVWVFYAGIFLLAALCARRGKSDSEGRINIANMSLLIVGIAYSFTLCSTSFSRIAILFAPYLIVAVPEYLSLTKESMHNMRTEKVMKAASDCAVYANHAKALIVVISIAVFTMRLAVNNIGLTVPYEVFF